MKKILFVADSLEFGGVEATLVSWLKYLNTIKDVQITLLLLRREGIFIKDLPKDIEVITIDKVSQKKLKPYKKEMIKNIQKFNIKDIYKLLKYIIACEFTSKYKKMSLGEKIRYNVIDNLEILKYKFDVAVAYSDHASMYYVCNKVIANKKVLWLHADYSRIKRNLKANLSEYKQFDNIVSVSKVIKQSFISKCDEIEDKVIVINNILDKEKIDNLKNAKVKEFFQEYINILSVGRLEKEKNFAKLIKAFSMMPYEIQRKARLYIIGQGGQEKKLQKAINKNNLKDKVFLLGGKENPYCYMNRCDIYIQPSLYEGFCTTVNEAKYLKKPMIVTNVGGMDELIEKDITGIIIDENNEQSICENLQKMIIDKDKRKMIESNLEGNIDDKVLKQTFLKTLGIEEL